MQNNRDRLKELINQYLLFHKHHFTFEGLIDYLLANGVIVPPCKVGDTVYFIKYKEILESTVVAIEINYYSTPKLWLSIEYYSATLGTNTYKSRIDLMLGKTVFLTKEEAEEKLKELG